MKGCSLMLATVLVGGVAMFFRRTINRKEDYVCRQPPDSPGTCNLSLTYSCKYCRLKKCQKLGMRDWRTKSPPSDLEVVPAKSPSLRRRVKCEERVSYPIVHPVTRKETEWINIDPLIRRSRKILEEDSIHFNNYFTHWEELMTRAAEWLMHSEQFYGLPEHERLNLFKIAWGVWRRFERNTMSVRVFGQKCLDERLLLISDDIATRIDDFHVDYSDLMENQFDRFRKAIRKNYILYFDIVVRPCLEWNFTDTEINFALSQIVWNYASRKLLGQTLQASDAFLSEISENLHEYYRNEMRLKNYAPRLAMLMEMVNGVLKIQVEHEKVMEFVFLFDSFGFILSEPSFFCV